MQAGQFIKSPEELSAIGMDLKAVQEKHNLQTHEMAIIMDFFVKKISEAMGLHFQSTVVEQNTPKTYRETDPKYN